MQLFCVIIVPQKQVHSFPQILSGIHDLPDFKNSSFPVLLHLYLGSFINILQESNVAGFSEELEQR